jgi:hypothetical protein
LLPAGVLDALELRFNKNKTDFVRQFITMDEAWIHHYTLESKEKSKQWTEAGCSAPKKTRSVELKHSFNSSKTPAGSNLGEYYQIL